MNASPLTPRNVSKRLLRSENTPPVKATKATSRLTGASARRKARNGMRSAQYDAEKAKLKSRQRPIRYVIQTVAPSSTDVEMQDAQPAIHTTPVSLPRALGRPTPSEPSAEAIKAACGSEYSGQTGEFIRDCLREEGRGYRLLRTNASVKSSPLTSLPNELSIIVNDLSATDLPTHMLAIYGRPTSNQPKAQVKLFPVHAMVFAAHCARLPPFPPSPNTTPVSPSSEPRETTVPIRPICLPHPQTFSPLLQYLYTFRPEVLYRTLLPTLPSSAFTEDPLNPDNILSLANELGRTFVVNVLLRHAMLVHGLWTNVCALGVADEGLWEIIDACWEVLLQALAVGTGEPRKVAIEDMRAQEQAQAQN
ncbi:hypothetical protein VKT23_008759 [Stygiomarasmius scandens]|uniref:BTB domain-containing protein n=1 Tax=Marasmiellus scandens TaxID=2682957 RepID=A0ABR1JHW5_9AGAR